MLSTDSSIYSSLIEISRPMKRRKVLLLGAPETGKSAILMRFKENVFLEIYEPTIQNSTKKFIPFRNEYVELEINDLDGQTEYTIFSQNKFSFGINGYLLVYSVNNRQSFELMKTINTKLNAVVGKKCPKILIGNKNDFHNDREVTFNEGKEFANSINCPFLETSAKTNDNIEKAFLTLLIEINKIENNFDIKKLCCSSLFESFVKKEKLMRYIFYILFILNIILGILSVIMGVLAATNAPFYLSFPYQYVPLGYGFWICISTGFGMFGLCKEKTDMINIHTIGVLIGTLFILVGLVLYFVLDLTIVTDNNSEPIEKYFKYIKIYETFISGGILFINIFTIGFSYIYKKIYELDLLSYII